MSAPCPIFGFVVHTAAGRDAHALARVLKERLATSGLVVDETERSAATLVITREGSQATESDRQLVIDLLEDDASARGATVSQLVDLTY